MDEEDGDSAYEFDYVGAFAQKLGANPDFREAINGINGLVSRVRGIVDQGFAPHAAPPQQRRPFPPPNGHARQAPPQRPQAPREDPRQVLGFGRDVKLTREMIKERRRQLASIFHSDKGGNDVSMARVNAAADVLLAQVGK